MIRSTSEAYGAPKGGRDMKGAGGFRYYLSRAENVATDDCLLGSRGRPPFEAVVGRVLLIREKGHGTGGEA